MASTYSDLKIELIGTGEQVGTWGITTNTNLGTALEEAITGSANVSFSSADVTLTLTNTNGTQTARNLRLVCTGTSGGARNLILGSGCQINKLYLVQNDLADAVTIKNTTGTGVTIPAGRKQFVFNNGTNVIEATTNIVDLTSGVTGVLPIANGGTNASTAANARTNLGLGTMATQSAGNVSISGGTIIGITDLAVADGGTGASDVGTARTNLDVPSRSGAGASGTWSINIFGNAATATTAANGGVTSLNGLTGAVSNTIVNSVGSYVIACSTDTPGNTTVASFYGLGTAVNGSSLQRFGNGASHASVLGALFPNAGQLHAQSRPDVTTPVSLFLSGTWRLMTPIWYPAGSWPTYGPVIGLYVRIT